MELDAKVELIRSLVPLGLMHVEELLDEEVTALAGERYARKDALVGGRRHGSNPGTVGLAGQRVPLRVPRIRHVAGSEMPLRSYEALHGDRVVNDVLLKRVLYGIVSFPDRLTVERRLLWSKERSCESRGSVRPKSLASCGMPRAACPCRDLLRTHGVSKATFFKWRSKYGGASVSDVRQLRELEAEHAKLKRMYANLALEHAAIKDVLHRKL